jgi:hypothetical protein
MQPAYCDQRTYIQGVRTKLERTVVTCPDKEKPEAKNEEAVQTTAKNSSQHQLGNTSVISAPGSAQNLIRTPPCSTMLGLFSGCHFSSSPSRPRPTTRPMMLFAKLFVLACVLVVGLSFNGFFSKPFSIAKKTLKPVVSR